MSGSYPFHGDTIYILLERIGKCEYTIPNDLPPHVQHLLAWMMTKRPQDRPSFAEISSHFWLTADVAFQRDEEASTIKAVHALSSKQSMFSLNTEGQDGSGGDLSAQDDSEWQARQKYGTTIIPFLETMFAAEEHQHALPAEEDDLEQSHPEQDEDAFDQSPDPLPLSQTLHSNSALHGGNSPRRKVQWQEDGIYFSS